MNWFRENLAEKSLVLLISGLFLFFCSFLLKFYSLKEEVLLSNLDTAALLSEMTAAAHMQYGKSVSGLSETTDVEFTTDTSPQKGEVHFPATFTKNLAEQITMMDKQSRLSFFSDSPFHTDRKQELDAFQKEALVALRKNGTETYWKNYETEDGKNLMRYAVPIVMQESCVECHNNPKWGLAKRDWKAGDVRGVRETSVYYNSVSLGQQTYTIIMLLIAGTFCIIGIFIAYPAITREVQQRDELEKLSVKLKKQSDLMKEQSDLMKEQALTDALTGLKNRRFFDIALADSMRKSQNKKEHLGLIIFDIDHFKSINDRYGHKVGDDVIQAFGHCIKQFTRQGDVAARIGGEEFALLVTRSDEDEMQRIAERIRYEIAKTPIVTSGYKVCVTVSGGYSIMHEHDNPQKFFKRSDANLYEAKRTGRDKICA